MGAVGSLGARISGFFYGILGVWLGALPVIGGSFPVQFIGGHFMSILGTLGGHFRSFFGSFSGSFLLRFEYFEGDSESFCGFHWSTSGL